LFERVVFPLDLTEPAVEILDNIRFLKQFNPEKVFLIYVATPGTPVRQKYRNRLKEYETRIGEEGLACEAVLNEGIPAKQVTELAKEKSAGLIYIPWRRKHALHRRFLGSSTREIIRLTETPVFIHKYTREVGERFSLENILYATDFDEAAKRAAPFLEFLSNRIQRIVFLYVGRRAADPMTQHERENRILLKLEELQKKIHLGKGTEVENHLETGNPIREILKKSRKSEIDLIVLGRFNDSPLRKVIGETAEKVADKSPCSILMIP
jgi:nucleotide-binding universal stress UspA family protein